MPGKGRGGTEEEATTGFHSRPTGNSQHSNAKPVASPSNKNGLGRPGEGGLSLLAKHH